MIRTEICDLLGIEYPIFQGGMAWVSDAIAGRRRLQRRRSWHHLGHELRTRE